MNVYLKLAGIPPTRRRVDEEAPLRLEWVGSIDDRAFIDDAINVTRIDRSHIIDVMKVTIDDIAAIIVIHKDAAHAR